MKICPTCKSKNVVTVDKNFEYCDDCATPTPKTLKRMDEMKQEIERQIRTRDLFLERFKLWEHNASLVGMTVEELDKPLPEVRRKR